MAIKDLDNTLHIYSEYLDEMIPFGFHLKYSRGDEVWVSDEHFTWNDEDCLYASDDIDDHYYFLEDTDSSYYDYWKMCRVDFAFDTQN